MAVTTYSYDANDNRILANAGGALTTYTWDTENRMLGASGNDTESFTYAGDGQRRSKSSSEEGVLYVWDGENVLEELNGIGKLIARYTDNPGYWGGLTSLFLVGDNPPLLPVFSGMGMFNAAQFSEVGFNQVGESSQGGSFFYLFDQNSNTRHLVDVTAQITDNDLYRAFGEQVVNTGNIRNPHRFQGQVGPYTDADSRVWMRARIYDLTTGQWNSPDPIGFYGGDWNLYSFVENDPLILNDPTGERPSPPSQAPKGYYWVWIRNDPFDPNLNSPGRWILERSTESELRSTLPSKPRESKAACFWRVYPTYRKGQKRGSRYEFSPQKACESANLKCKSHIKCGICGPYLVPTYTGGCASFSTLTNFANTLHDDCGGKPGSDKLAHCWAACMVGMCGGVVGAATWRLFINKGDEVSDKAAEGYGLSCSCQGLRGNTVQSASSKSAFCIKCCGSKIKGMISN